MRAMKIQIKKLRPDAVTPTAGSAHSAGYDLYACMDAPLEIPPHETAMIHLGFSAAIPEGYFGAIFPRSGLATRRGLRLANCVGVCDCDYRGEYMVPLYNDSGETRVVSPGDRVAQLVVLPYQLVEFESAGALPETGRGTGGFGSTGV